MKTIAIYDSEHPLAVNNRCFDESIADTGAGISMNVLMYKKAKERGIDFITADKYLAMDTSPRALCVTDMVSPNTEALLKKGAYPAVCFSMESPIIAKRYYHNIKKYSGRFCHSIQFRGTNERLKSTGTKLHCMHFPVEKSFPPLSKNSWQEKKFLTLINSNKRSISKDFIGISGVKNIAKNLVFLWWKLIDPWMRAREIYIDRIEAILYFSKYRDFHLYGENWNKPIPGYGSKEQKTAEISWKGRLDYKQKKQTLNEYKFSSALKTAPFRDIFRRRSLTVFKLDVSLSILERLI